MATSYQIAEKNITIGMQAGTDRTAYAQWILSGVTPSYIDSFSYEWEYLAGGKWFSGSTGSTNYIVPFDKNKARSNVTYSIPENATKLRFRVLPVAKKHKVNKKDTAYFSAGWSTKVKWTPPKPSVPKPTDSLTVGKVSIRPESGADRTVIATWKVDKDYDKKIASFTYQWQARIDKTWLDKGGNGSSLSNVRNCEFSYPENATAIRLRVKPEPKQHTVKGQQVDWFTGKYSGWTEYKIPKAAETSSPTVTTSLTPSVKLTILNAPQRKLAGTWSANDPHGYIDSFEWEWYYYDKITGIRLSGGSGTTASDLFSASFTVDESAKSVEFRVRAVPKQHEVSGQQVDYFVGYWATVSFDTKHFEVSSRLPELIATPNIVVWDLDTRRVLGTWGYEDPNDQVESVDYEWRYYELHNGKRVLVPGTSGNATVESGVTSSFYTPPEEAYSVELRTKPVSKKTQTIYGEETDYFDGAWGYRELELPGIPRAPSIRRMVSNLQIGLQNEDGLDILVVWGMYDQEGYVESFSFESMDYVSGQWLDGQSGTTQGAETFAATFSPNQNATKVRVRVKPNPKTFQAGTQTFDRFVSEWTDWKIFELPAIPKEPDEELTVSNINIDLLEEDEKTVYATWGVLDPYEHVDSFSYEWRYYSRSGFWLPGSSGTAQVGDKVATYGYPDGAVMVQVRVKPEPKQHSVYGQQVDWFKGVWSNYVNYTLPEVLTPDVPDTPAVSVSGYNLLASVNCYDAKAQTIEFEVVEDNKTVFATGSSAITMAIASYQFTITSGKIYKVRARARNDFDVSDWSQYSENVGSVPAAPTNLKCNAKSSTSVELTWNTSANASTHVIQYATKKRYFDTAPNEVQEVTIDLGTKAEITGLDTGEEYFFRVRAENSYGSSTWSGIASTVLGKLPDAPTTWSSTTTASIGKSVTLYWIHNAADESKERSAELELDVNGTIRTITIENKNVDDEDDSGRHSYVLDTRAYLTGAQIRWRVRTRGIVPGYGEWSVQRIIDVYAPPYLNMQLGTANEWWWDPFNFQNGYIYSSEGDTVPLENDTLRYFPLFIRLESGPQSQTPVSYHISILANDTYTDTDDIGNDILVVKDQEVFSRYYDTDQYLIIAMLTANDINLSNGISYTIRAIVSMDSGLTAEATSSFTVSWDEEEHNLNAELSVDMETLTAFIKPYCDNEDGEMVDPMELAVYRREFDGSFVEVASGISNVLRPTVTDPHPALNYARYRIVGKSQKTGKVSFTDLPGYPIGEPSIVIQWNEEWSEFNPEEGEEELVERPWSGSMVKLKANVDLSEKNEMDVEFAEYIGRKHPVSYYGTQVGQSMSLKTDVDASDNDTIYALRRLMVWPGDVYIREPNGNGYWANISISFNKDHCEVVVPVSIEAKRVEGGL